MRKSLMISIQPKHLVNILNGNKTLELRKAVPKDFKGWVYIYCTKSKKTFRVGSLGFYEDVLYKLPNGQIKFGFPYEVEKKTFLNGKVVARFWFEEYEGIDYQRTTLSETGYEILNSQVIIRVMGTVKYILNVDISDKLCLTYDEVEKYGKGKDLYAWHIKKLEIFDTPLSLSDFYKANLYASGQVIKEYEKQTNDFSYRLKRPPQSYQYVYKRKEELK